MPGLLSRLVSFATLESDGRASWLDAEGTSGHTWGMPPCRDLSADNVHTDDVGDYNVTEPGWYAVDDGDKVVLGPFDGLAQCEGAIRERKRPIDA